MKKMKKVTVSVLALVLALSLMACGGSKSVVGTWTMEGTDADISSLELKNDGTGSITLGESISLNITYTTEKDKLTLTMSYLGETESEEYTYSVKDNKLTLNNGSEDITFIKK